MPSALFLTNHCYLDFASGATVSLRELFHFLHQRGWDLNVLCGQEFDARETVLKNVLREKRITGRTWTEPATPSRFAVHRIRDNGAGVTIFEPAQWPSPPTLDAGYPFLQLLDRTLTAKRPDVMLTFGGGWLGRAVMTVAARHGVPVVFWLRNDKYHRADIFSSVAATIVASQYMADHYRKAIGIPCEIIPSPVRPERVLCPNRKPQCATFVGLLPDKGVFYFARLVAELGKRRPDIPVLAVIGRGNIDWLRQSGLNLRGLPNFKIMNATDDPRQFLGVTRVLLAPSLWREAFLRVAVEAMLNGIPTLASRRGGIPSTLGNSGFLFDIPEKFTPTTRLVPEAAEVEPWISTVIRLWDDPAFYKEQSDRSLAESRRFSPEVVIGAHENVLEAAIAKGKPPQAPLPPFAQEMQLLQKYFKEPINLARYPEIGIPNDMLAG